MQRLHFGCIIPVHPAKCTTSLTEAELISSDNCWTPAMLTNGHTAPRQKVVTMQHFAIPTALAKGTLVVVYTRHASNKQTQGS
jgi:hypothetical protein